MLIPAFAGMFLGVGSLTAGNVELTRNKKRRDELMTQMRREVEEVQD